MLRAIVTVIALTVAGATVAQTFSLPIPGSAVGMMALALMFGIAGRVDVDMGRLFDAASPHFALFFVPAAVGVIARIDLLLQAWVPILCAIVAGTVVTIAAVGLLAQCLMNVEWKEWSRRWKLRR